MYNIAHTHVSNNKFTEHCEHDDLKFADENSSKQLL